MYNIFKGGEVLKKEIKKITVSSIFSALIVVLIMLGTFLEILDITVAAVCSLVVFIVLIEEGGKYPLLVYLVSSVLCLIFVSQSSATLYFVAFFGYYPILKLKLKKLSKVLRKTVCIVLFNIATLLLFLIFKAIFAMQNEPAVMYILLIILSNVFFLCFDRLLDVFAFIYFKKLRNKIKFLK